MYYATLAGMYSRTVVVHEVISTGDKLPTKEANDACEYNRLSHDAAVSTIMHRDAILQVPTR